MKIDINFYEQEIDCYLDPEESFYTFGGEYWDDDYHHDAYGLQFDNLTIYDIPSKQFEQIAISMMNHLMTNGYDYTIDRNHNGYFIRRM